MNASSVLVISDSHGNIAALTAILKWTRDTGLTCDAAVFLGDGFDDLAPASTKAGFVLPWNAVRGNGDYNFSVPAYMLLEISGHTLFLTHGDRYRVREGGKTIAAIARNAGAEAALFGHTHIPCFAETDGIVLLNPGSISRPRDTSGCTFAVLECPDSGHLSARFYTLAHKLGKLIIKQL